jgi:HEPN domain-containing protein
MSAEKNRDEAKRWLETGKSDLETARILLSNKRYAHACFHAQQAGEKCVKALWFLADSDPWGHSIRRLIEEFPGADGVLFKDLMKLSETGAKLDRYYIPTRYPNGLPELTPDQAYFEEDARAALSFAHKLMEIAEKIITVG